jgi:predicted ATPase
VPLLAGLLSLPLPAGQATPFALSPQQQRHRTLEVLVHLVGEQAAAHPVVFLVEDVHWVDPSTSDFLHLLMAQTSTVRVLVVLTGRPTFAWPAGQQTTVTPLALTRLTAAQTAQLITQVAGGKPLPAEVLAQLVARADGVPLYAEELTRMVLESGQLRETATQYELRDRLAPLSVPATLQDSLMARLDQLGEGKEVAQWGAVLGREFRHEVLAAVTAFDDERLQASLRPLLAAELLLQRGVGAQAVYRFRHALLQEAAYTAILQRQRQQMHARIAQVLEAHFAAVVAGQPELVAYHHREAGHLEQAVLYWHQAGRLASERSAYVEAVSHLTQGLTLLATLREQSETPARLHQEVAIHIALGPALVAIKGFGALEVEHTYIQARALCQRLGNVPELFSILGGLWRCYIGREDMRPVRALADEILRLAEASPDRSLRVEAYRVQGLSRLFLGDVDAARGFLEQCVALYDPEQHQDHLARYGGAAAGVTALACLSTVLWLLGYPQQAVTRSAQAIALAQALGHPFSLAFALSFTMTLSFHLRQPQATHALAERLIALAGEQQFPYWLASGMLRRGWALVAQGQVAEGMAQLQRTWTTVERTLLESDHVVMADAYARAGQPAEGLAVLHDALAAMHEQSKTYWTPEVYRLRGDLLLQQTPPDVQQAEASWQQALALARSQPARSLELRAATRLARLWQRQGKPAAARALLEPIYNAFTEGFDTPDLQEALALLEALR